MNQAVPLLNFMGSPIDARAVEVPKHKDFHPDPKVRRSRSMRPAIAYPTKKEILCSLRDPEYQLAKRSLSKQSRVKFQRIIEKRKKGLRNGQFREAIATLEQSYQASPQAQSHTELGLGFEYVDCENRPPASSHPASKLAHSTSPAMAGPRTDTEAASTEDTDPIDQTLELNLFLNNPMSTTLDFADTVRQHSATSKKAYAGVGSRR